MSIDNLTRKTDFIVPQIGVASDSGNYHGETLALLVDSATAQENLFDVAYSLWYQSNNSDILFVKGQPNFSRTFAVGGGRTELTGLNFPYGCAFQLNVGNPAINAWYGDDNFLKLGFCRRKFGPFHERAYWINAPGAEIIFGAGAGDGMEVVLYPGVTGTIEVFVPILSAPIVYRDPSGVGAYNQINPGFPSYIGGVP